MRLYSLGRQGAAAGLLLQLPVQAQRGRRLQPRLLGSRPLRLRKPTTGLKHLKVLTSSRIFVISIATFMGF